MYAATDYWYRPGPWCIVTTLFYVDELQQTTPQQRRRQQQHIEYVTYDRHYAAIHHSQQLQNMKTTAKRSPLTYN